MRDHPWAWLSADRAASIGVHGLKRPEDKRVVDLYWKNQEVNALLMGIESSAPMRADAFGNTHSVDAKSKDLSAFGKRKWRDYRSGGEEVPADLGGIRVYVDEAKFSQLQQVCEAAKLCRPSDGIAQADQENEMQLFQELLKAP